MNKQELLDYCIGELATISQSLCFKNDCEDIRKYASKVFASLQAEKGLNYQKVNELPYGTMFYCFNDEYIKLIAELFEETLSEENFSNVLEKMQGNAYFAIYDKMALKELYKLNDTSPCDESKITFIDQSGSYNDILKQL